MVPVETFIAVVVAMLGLIFGSFMNVVIYRVPRKESIAWPGSHCPGCGAEIGVLDNIPLLSFLILRGKCRHCGAPISWQYPLVEATTALFMLSAFFKYGQTPRFVAAAIFLWVLLALSVIDIQFQKIPNVIVVPVGAVALAAAAAQLFFSARYLPLVDKAGALNAVIGFAIGGGLLMAIALVRPGGMGGGDVKLAAFMGIFLGRYILVGLFLGFLFGSIAGIFSMVALHKTRKDLLPFGPYLALGSLLTLAYGPAIWAWYAALSGFGG